MPRPALPPPVTRGLLLVLLGLSLINATLRLRRWTSSLPALSPTQLATTPSNYLSDPRWAVPYLVLVPVRSLAWPWTIVFAGLVENNLVSLSISTAVLWFGGRYLERAWGGKEFAIFCAVVIGLSNAWSCLVYGLWHAMTGAPEFPTPIQGLVALEAAFLVSLKQLVPEHTVSLFRASLRCRIKHFPAIFVVANMLSGPLLGTDTAFWLSLSGFLISWTYLRFFRLSDLSPSGLEAGEGGVGMRMRGDASDTFAFVAFFPDFLHPFLAPICDGTYATLVQLGLCLPFSDEAIEAGNDNVRASQSDRLPSGGARRAEAERRRMIALKALDQRLNAAAASRASGNPVNTAPSTSDIAPDVTAGSSVAVEAAKEAQA